jgi:hypothetical protein
MVLRSSMEFAKRVFIDRLTTDQYGSLVQPDIGNFDEGPGDEYDYGGCYDPDNLGIGADCSGSAGIFLGAALLGPAGMSWDRQFTTETFCNWPPGNWRQTTQEDLVNNYYPAKVCIMHGGGGPDSHMNCSVDGIVMESNGDYGTCTLGHGAIAQDDDYWNDWWVLDEPVVEDTTYRTPMVYPQGFDYAVGPISGADLKAAGKSFVCRYVTPSLQWKCLQPGEFQDLVSNGIVVVFNYEGEGNGMLNGNAQGIQDAQEALNYIRSLPGVPAGYNPVVYFSCDFDESPDQDGALQDYLAGCAQVLGGVQYVGIYGGYWPLSRMLDAGACTYAWQTEAWSGGNLDARVNIVQRNGVGFQNFDGVQCDADEAHTDNFGQYLGGDMPESTADLILDQLAGPLNTDGTRGWAQLGNRSIVDFLAQVVGPALTQIQATVTAGNSKAAKVDVPDTEHDQSKIPPKKK